MEHKKGEYLDMDEDKRQQLDQQAEEYVDDVAGATRDERRARPPGIPPATPTRPTVPNGRGVLTRPFAGPARPGGGPGRATITACRPDIRPVARSSPRSFGGAAVVVAPGPPGVGAARGALAVSRPLARLPALPGRPAGPPTLPPGARARPLTASAASRRPRAAPDPDAPTPADRAAGIRGGRSRRPAAGSSTSCRARSPAPGRGEVRTVRVEVERGLPVDGARFAGFVLATLNDDRSWGHDGAMTFARTDGDAADRRGPRQPGHQRARCAATCAPAACSRAATARAPS